jgi:hypothetical protein
VLQKQSAPQKAFSTVACTIRIHLISMLCFKELIQGKAKYYRKEDPQAGQPDLFGNIKQKRKERKRRKKTKNNGGNPSESDKHT